MKDRHVLDELSAYLDGECPDPDRVERHLADCTDCTRQCDELRALSTRVRGLTPPEVRPEFATRVLARVRAPRRPGRSSSPSWTLAVAAVVLVVAIAALHFARTPSDLSTDARRMVANAALPDEALLVAELERRIGDGEEVGAFESGELFVEEASRADWIELLAASDWFDTLADAFEADADLDALVLTLGDDEAEVFKELLSERLEQGWST